MKKFLAVFAVIALVAFAAPAFAANPFMDVPAGHWAYDAVAQLAARGVVSGYPDGAFKGAQPATRYEVASVVARALAKVDAEKASKQDLEMLKKLVMEFKDELDALGVKVDKIDKRVAVLEDRLGGWKLRGLFVFDAAFGGGDNQGAYTNSGQDNEFRKEKFRLMLTKYIDENTYFYGQYRTGSYSFGTGGLGDNYDSKWANLYVDTKLPYDIGFRVGRFTVDFEGDAGLYTDADATFGDFRIDGFQFKKTWGMLNATAVIGRNTPVDSKFGGYLEDVVPTPWF
ncbi:MAG TPA: S-layer homology domain-containing protein, partial [Synergistaceae bacterium]|nr:S-layer homology domain-containing protein [Synergistaceae bacterium]